MRSWWRASAARCYAAPQTNRGCSEVSTHSGATFPRAMLLTYPDTGHGSLFQYHESFVRQASLFLDSEAL